jgi:hypothetical protein
MGIFDEFELMMRVRLDNLWDQIASGALSAEDANQKLKISEAVCKLMLIATELGLAPTTLEERMQFDKALVALWPEACRRSGIRESNMPQELMRCLLSLVGRPN